MRPRRTGDDRDTTITAEVTREEMWRLRCDMLLKSSLKAMEGMPILTVTAVRKQRRQYLRTDQGRQVQIGSVFQQDDRLWCVEGFGSPPRTTGRGMPSASIYIPSTSACHERGPSGLKGWTHQVSPKNPLVTPKSETRSEISVKFGIYKVKDENFHVRCLPPYI